MMRWVAAYLQRFWFLWLALLAIVLLLAANMAAIPMVTEVKSVADLNQRLGDATIAEANIVLRGDIRPEEAQQFQESLGSLVVESIEVRQSRLRAFLGIYDLDGLSRPLEVDDFFLDFWAVDKLSEKATLREGRWPTPAEFERDASSLDLPIVEVAVGQQAFEMMELELGDLFRPGIALFQAQVVGVVAVNDPTEPIWWGDRNALPFIARRRFGFNPDVEELTISLLLPIESMDNYIIRSSEWRFLLDAEQLAEGDPVVLLALLRGVISKYSDPLIGVTSGIVELYEGHLQAVSQARATSFLLLVQSMLGALYTIGVLATLLTEQSRSELGVLAGRGFKRWHLTGRFAILGTIAFGLVAFPLAPLLARLTVQLWLRTTVQITSLSWLMAAVVVIFAWLVLTISVHLASRQSIVTWLQRRSRPEEVETGQQQLVFDGMILLLGALIFWQLQRSGTVLALDESSSLFGRADPLLLLAPTILIIALAIVWRRLFPLILRATAAVARHSEGFTIPLSLTRLARSPRVPAQLILLITVTAALTVFSFVFVESLERRQRNLAEYLSGAELRIGLPLGIEDAAAWEADIVSHPDVTAYTRSYRGAATLLDDLGSRIVGTVLAVDTESLAEVSYYPAGISQFAVVDILNVLKPKEAGIPVVISTCRSTAHLQNGDQLELQVGSQQIPAQIVGIINEFPSLDGMFFLTDLELLSSQARLQDITIIQGQNELWLSGLTELPSEFVDQEEIELLSSAQELNERFSAGLVTQQTLASLRLNRNLLILLSGLGFLLAQLFTARQRLSELAILQAIGAERKRIQLLLFSEGIVMLMFGLGMGLISGYALAWMMRPMLEQTLEASLSRYGIGPLATGWFSLLFALLLLLAAYGLTLILLRLLLGRLQVASSLRLAEE